MAELARVVAKAAGRVRRPQVGVHGADDALVSALVATLHRRMPGVTVRVLPVDQRERHLVMCAAGRFDVILDAVLDDSGPQGRADRFRATFFHLRAGGGYVVRDGAREADPLAGLLSSARASAGAGLRTGPHRRRETPEIALRDHVASRKRGRHLVVTHDLPDVVLRVHERDYDDYLDRAERPHRLLALRPAGEPPPDPPGEEGPSPGSKRGRGATRSGSLRLREYRDVVAAPGQVLLDRGVVLPDSWRRPDRSHPFHVGLVEIAPDAFVPRTSVPADLPRLAGTYLHLDSEYRGHFGHLLTETLSRVWAWPEVLALDPDARVLVGSSPRRPALLGYELEIYEAAGIPRDRVVLIEGPARVERVFGATAMFSNPSYVHPGLADVWKQVGDRLASGMTHSEWPRRFFVGRAPGKRGCVNGEELEAVFVEHGFTVLRPEELPLGDQVALFRQAEVVAGYAGSGLFQSAFVDRPQRVVRVTSETYWARNEHLIAAVRGHRLDHVVCRALDKGMQADFVYDEQREGPFLRGLLADL